MGHSNGFFPSLISRRGFPCTRVHTQIQKSPIKRQSSLHCFPQTVGFNVRLRKPNLIGSLIRSGWVPVGSSMMSLFTSLAFQHLWQALASWPHALDFLTWSIISTYFCWNRDFCSTFQLSILCKYTARCVQSLHTSVLLAFWRTTVKATFFPLLILSD